MLHQGILPDGITYKALVGACGQGRYLQRALQLLETMRCQGILPDGIPYKALVRACGRGRELQRAVQLLKTMLYQGILPDGLNALVSACGKGHTAAESFTAPRDNAVPSLSARWDPLQCLGDCLRERGTTAEKLQPLEGMRYQGHPARRDHLQRLGQCLRIGTQPQRPCSSSRKFKFCWGGARVARYALTTSSLDGPRWNWKRNWPCAYGPGSTARGARS